MNSTNKKIVGVIPAAGKGTRLSPFPCPKELFPIGYQEMIVDGITQKRPKVISQYLIENIINAGAEKLFLILGEDKFDIMRYYSDGARFNVDISYLYQEKLYGMPYALNLIHNWLTDEIVLFGMPDTIIEPGNAFQQLIKYHLFTKSDLTLGLFKTDNPSKFGMVDFDADNKVRCIIDKPKSTNLKYMWGCACWSPSFSELMNNYLNEHPFVGKEILLGDIFQHAVDSNLCVSAIKFSDGNYIDIGTVDELDSALKKFHL